MHSMSKRRRLSLLFSGCGLILLAAEEVQGQINNIPQFIQQNFNAIGAVQRTPGQAFPAGGVPGAPTVSTRGGVAQLSPRPTFPGLPPLPGLPGVPGGAGRRAPAMSPARPPPLAAARLPASRPLSTVPSLGRVTFPVPQPRQQHQHQQAMNNAIGRVNQQLSTLRSRLATVSGRTAPGLSLLQSQTTPAILREGSAALRALQRTADRVSRGQAVQVSELIYPPAILTILNGASAQPTTSTGVTPRPCNERRRRCELPRHVRSIDGTCNNLRRSHWGRADSPLIRLAPSTYSDGILQPRTRGRDGSPLPSARLISSRCTTVGEGGSSVRFTLSLMQWGQFIDHDLVHTPVQRLNVTTGVDCCSEGVSRDRVRQLPECFPIDVPSGDPFYGRFRVRCLNFLRSIPALGEGCADQPAQQVNQITHWLDGSNVYGSSAADLAQLRRGSSHLLRTSANHRLPRMGHGHGEGCVENNGICFRAGDSRVNEQISLTAIHNIWVMMHNRIANILRRLNPRASAEDVFQESRSVNVALMQHIVYSEWLPLVIGPATVRRLRLDRPGPYRPDIHPAIVNEFATAAFRFGHSLVAGRISVPGRGRPIRLSDIFFNPGGHMRRRGMLLSLVRGLVSQPSQRMDTTFSHEIVGLLFRGERRHGLDLVALNIQRGRDHGIASYSQTWAALSGACPELGDPPTRWEHLNEAMSPGRVAQLRSVYRSVEDVDLFVGGVAEDPAPGALVGPTFQCLLAEQFTRLKYADRHFYNHNNGMFNSAQLSAIDSMSWASVLCELFPELGTIQREAFLISRGGRQRCRRRRLTLAAWRNVLPRP